MSYVPPMPPPMPPPGPPHGVPYGLPYGPTEVRVRYNPVLGVVFLVLGILFIALALLTERAMQLVPGIVFVVVGPLYLAGTYVVVQPHEVQLKSPLQFTVRRHPIHGFGDLWLDGKVLRRRGDGKRLASFGWGASRGGDVAALAQAIAYAPR